MKLERKQKVIITFIIIVAAFLVWQIYDMFFAGISRAPAPSPTPAVPSIPVARAPVTVTVPPSIQPLTPGSATTLTNQMSPSTTTPFTEVKQVTLQAPITPEQRSYLRLANRYQLIKMQRQVAEEEAGMMSARLKVAQLNQQLAKISGGPALVSGGPSLGFGGNVSPLRYQLMYIDFQNGGWSATLNKNGQLIEVIPGMTLVDGNRILKIDQNGVIIKQGNNTYLLSFYGTTPIKALPAMTMAVPIKNVVTLPPVVTKQVRKVVSKPQPQKKVKAKRRITVQELKVNAPIKTITVKPAIAQTRPHVSVPVVTVTNRVAEKSVVSTAQLSALPTTPPSVAAIPSISTKISPDVSTVPSIPTKPVPPIVPPMTPVLQSPPPSLTSISNRKEPLSLTAEQKTTVNQLETYLNTGKNRRVDQIKYTTDEQHILTLPESYYTLQLFGSRKLSDLTALVKRHKLETRTYIFHTFYLGKDWYVLIYGAYKTEQEALDTIKTLPRSLQDLKPWVRSIKNVQNSIKNPKKD